MKIGTFKNVASKALGSCIIIKTVSMWTQKIFKFGFILNSPC